MPLVKPWVFVVKVSRLWCVLPPWACNKPRQHELSDDHMGANFPLSFQSVRIVTSSNGNRRSVRVFGVCLSGLSNTESHDFSGYPFFAGYPPFGYFPFCGIEDLHVRHFATRISGRIWSSHESVADFVELCQYQTSNTWTELLYKSLYISSPSSAKQQREMTKFCVVYRAWMTMANLSYFHLELNAIVAYLAWARF